MARYLITGGCGFIGSNLADKLIKEKDEVLIIDNLSTGKIKNVPEEAEVVVGDILDVELLGQLFNVIDGCFHLAAIASVQKSVEEPERTNLVNVVGTENIFNMAAHNKTPVVYASSAAIYGNNDNVPLNESETPSPLTPYGEHKLANEKYAEKSYDESDVASVGLRFFNVYGSKQDPSSPYSGVISIFSDRIGKGEDITIFGDGEQGRDFIYVGDVVDALIAAMEKDKHHEVGNISTGKETTINQLADIIENITGNKVNRNYEKARKGDIKISIGDPKRMNKYLGLEAKTELQYGLKNTIK